MNRTVGWALTDVHLNDDRDIDDVRIDDHSPVLAHTPRLDLLDDFRAWLDDRYKDSNVERRISLGKLGNNLAQSAPRDAVTVYDEDEDEAGTNAVLLVRPVHMTGWHRHDDDLDYIDACARGATMEPILQELNFSPFPYDGQWMDAETGLALNSRDVDEFRFLRDVPDLTDGRAEFAQRLCGTADWDEAARRIVPNVPRDVRDLLDWSGLLTSPETVGTLRPVLFTYWQ